ncbi:MAG TPA: hypothetical protein VMH48_03335 [Methylomirabilota bacterium]|nr:hypothetical protein [Methylomirabilota bacterium]
MKLFHVNSETTWTGMLAACVLLFAAAALLVALPAPSSKADVPVHFLVYDRDSVVYGRTYSDWSAAWEQWVDSIPTANHPLFDNGDCSVDQSGPVWFLGGKFIALGGTGRYDNVVRNCKVPFGKALYVAIFNSEDSALEETTFNHLTQIADIRAYLASQLDLVTKLTMDVDGQGIPNIKDNFRVQSPAFGFTLPDDNFFTAVGEGPFTAGTYFPGVDDGFYVMLRPLPLGHHTVHFHGESGTFVLDITYHIFVYH